MASGKGHKASWIRKLLVFLNILAVLLLLSAYAALFTDPRTFWPLAFAGLAYPVILVVNLGFILIWLVTWKRVIFLSLVTVLAGWTQLTTLVPLRLTSPKTTGTGNLGIITYNVHGFNYPNAESSEVQHQVAAFLKGETPLVVCMQEFKPRGASTLKGFGDEVGLPHFYQKNYLEYRDRQVTYGLVIYSRNPVLQTGFLRDGRERVFAVWADVSDGTTTYRVYNCHLVSVRFGAKDYTFYEDLKHQSTENLEIKEGVLNIFQKLKRAFIMRSGQVESLLGSVRKSPFPVILAGDLNDTPFSYTYHQLTRNLSDAYREAGKGWAGNTFAGHLPSYRIDYILHSEKMKAVRYVRHGAGFSDHYPVSATLSAKP